MSVEERDHYSGHMTTGHDWNGIKELNTPIPKVLIFFLVTTFLFSVGYWYLMPAWPLGNTFTPGKLGVDQQQTIETQMAEAAADKAHWADKISGASFEEIGNDAELVRIVNQSAPALFRDNCAMCHGYEAKGARYFPNLTDASWLWGGSAEEIYKTLQVGINAGVPGTRITSMLAFGDNGVLDASAISNVVTYVRSLSDPQIGNGANAAELKSVKAGESAFKQNCAACHGSNGQGNIALGAPNLTDNYWIYGGDKQSLTDTLQHGRAGQMPAWQGRLSEVDMKILAQYVAGLSAGK